MTATRLDTNKAEAFAERLLDILNSGAITQWLALRDRFSDVSRSSYQVMGYDGKFTLFY